MSLDTGQIQDDWLMVNVVPVYIKGYRCSVENYRSSYEDMACNLSSSAQIGTVFLDFAKAFDKVPRQRLLVEH